VVSLVWGFVVSSLAGSLEVFLELVHPHSQELDALLPENNIYTKIVVMLCYATSQHKPWVLAKVSLQRLLYLYRLMTTNYNVMFTTHVSNTHLKFTYKN